MIDSKIQQELRERFNPEGSLLRKHQMRMLDILIEVDRICRKHNIRYWIEGGTLLGAVRHGGFIPWDDDMDIAVMHNDYKRMLDVLEKELPENMKVQTHKTDPYFCLLFAKIRDTNSEIIESHKHKYKYNGIFIDIFPMKKINKFLSYTSYVITYWCFEYIYKFRKNNKKFIKMAFYCLRIMYFFFEVVNFIIPNKKINYYWGTFFENNSEEKDIFPLTRLDFEGYKFNAPKNYEQVLRNCFGDYNKLPDLNNLNPHIVDIIMKEI